MIDLISSKTLSVMRSFSISSGDVTFSCYEKCLLLATSYFLSRILQEIPVDQGFACCSSFLFVVVVVVFIALASA